VRHSKPDEARLRGAVALNELMDLIEKVNQSIANSQWEYEAASFRRLRKALKVAKWGEWNCKKCSCGVCSNCLSDGSDA
jgi:hypothetical protein